MVALSLLFYFCVFLRCSQRRAHLSAWWSHLYSLGFDVCYVIEQWCLVGGFSYFQRFRHAQYTMLRAHSGAQGKALRLDSSSGRLRSVPHTTHLFPLESVYNELSFSVSPLARIWILFPQSHKSLQFPHLQHHLVLYVWTLKNKRTFHLVQLSPLLSSMSSRGSIWGLVGNKLM